MYKEIRSSAQFDIKSLLCNLLMMIGQFTLKQQMWPSLSRMLPDSKWNNICLHSRMFVSIFGIYVPKNQNSTMRQDPPPLCDMCKSVFINTLYVILYIYFNHLVDVLNKKSGTGNQERSQFVSPKQKN